MSAIETLLESFRAGTSSERDKDKAFEKLVKAWLVKDPVQALRIKRVETWAEWAAEKGHDRTDTGIDLVATLLDGGFTAIQCKFLESVSAMQCWSSMFETCHSDRNLVKSEKWGMGRASPRADQPARLQGCPTRMPLKSVYV